MNYNGKIAKYFSVPYVDDRGLLNVITENLPINNFDIKRVFYVKVSKKDVIRGNHAHYKIIEIIFNISGRFEIEYYNNTNSGKIFLKENEGIVIDPLTWVNIKSLSDDSIYLVLANGEYEENENIRDKDKFMDLISK